MTYKLKPIILLLLALAYIFSEIFSFEKFANNAQTAALILNIFILAVCAFAMFFPRGSLSVRKDIAVGIGQRFWAAWLDSYVAFYIVAGLMFFIDSLYLTNLSATQFSVVWETPYVRLGVMILILIAYFYGHYRFSKPTVGQYMLGFKLVPEVSFTRSSLFIRYFWGIWPFIFSPIAWLMLKDIKGGVYSWDRKSKIMAVSLASPNPDS